MQHLHWIAIGSALAASLLACGSPQQHRLVPAGHVTVREPTERHTGADRTTLALEHGYAVMAGGSPERGTGWDGFGRGEGAAPRPDTPPSAGEGQLLREVHQALLADRRIASPIGITVELQPGAIVLGGTVANRDEERAAVATVRGVAGGRRVDDRLSLPR